MNIHDILLYIWHNWLQIVVDLVAFLNVIAAGSRVMGWDKFSEECGKLEDAIKAMIAAGVSRNQQAKKQEEDSSCGKK